MSSELKGIADTGLPKGLPDDAVPFCATNGTKVALAATPQEVKAAVGGKNHYVTRAWGFNVTTAETATLHLADGTTKKAVIVPLNFDDTDVPPTGGVYEFDPPVKIEGAVQVYCEADVGDSYLTVEGYVGT